MSAGGTAKSTKRKGRGIECHMYGPMERGPWWAWELPADGLRRCAAPPRWQAICETRAWRQLVCRARMPSHRRHLFRVAV